jgi:hypothetical protein
MKMAAFWDLAPCSLEVDRCFRGAYCLHQGDDHPDDGGSAHLKHRSTSTRLHGTTYQKAAIFVLAAVRTGYLIFCIIFKNRTAGYMLFVETKRG